MKWFNLDTIKNSSFYFTPNLPVIATKRYKFSLMRGIGYILLYTLASWLVLILILSITPLKDVLFVVDNTELNIQTEKVEKLQNRVILLTQQLQEMESLNARIKYAIKLAEKDTIGPKNPLYDTLKKAVNRKVKIEGNVFGVFNFLIEKYFQSEKKENKLFFFEPAQGMVIQQFDEQKGHLGIDYGVRKNNPVFASAGGIVTFADYTIDSGYTIMIQHDQNYISVYEHCSSLIVKARDVVKQGEIIALSGNSGKNTTGPHLHFEIWENGKPIDPQVLFIR